MNRIPHDSYVREFVRFQLRFARNPIPLLPSEMDLFESLGWLGLPQFGSGFVADPNAALRRKNVAAEIEDDLWPGLGNGVDAKEWGEEDSHSPDVDVDMQEYYSSELEMQDSELSLSIITRSEYFERVKGIRIPR